MTKNLNQKDVLTTKEAAACVPLSVSRLCKRRHEGLPPRYFKVNGQVFYRRSELNYFMSTYPANGGRKIKRWWFMEDQDVDMSVYVDNWAEEDDAMYCSLFGIER